MAKRIKKAVCFHGSTMELGETLECFPEKVEELIDIFDSVDGYASIVWSSLASNPFIGGNLERSRKSYTQSKKPHLQNEESRQTHVREDRAATDEQAKLVLVATRRLDSELIGSNGLNLSNHVTGATTSTQGVLLSDTLQVDQTSNRGSAEERPRFTRLTAFSTGDRCSSERLFASTLPPGQDLNESDLPSSNILAIVVLQARTEIGSAHMSSSMSIDGSDWEVYTISLEGSTWFYATFSSSGVPYVRRTSKNFPAWLKHTDFSKARPNTISAALSCIPPNCNIKLKLVESNDGKQKTLVFESLELAVRMEAAFWLERQFLAGKRHWYQHYDIANMVGRLKSEYQAEKKRKKKKKTSQLESTSD